ncbi:MAG: 1,4-alpha-glucan-branching enzyme, partial [Clostridia bacterium]|nr:1,4-alpha-glucan-branching enzyme [Clostridia bacterium]
MSYRITELDPYLLPHLQQIDGRYQAYQAKRQELVGKRGSLLDFANAHLYFGIHRTEDGWVYREWAPGADAMYFTGDFNGWDLWSLPMTRLENGVFEVQFGGKDALQNGMHIQAIVVKDGQMMRRVPAYATRVEQDPVTYLWCAVVEDTFAPYDWTDEGFVPQKTPFIYECHIGMAGEEGKVSNYREFTKNVLPRVKALGYNTLQIMAIMEHPYYGSFGYQVSNFYAPSSRLGTAEELKELINTAHGMGIAVLLDVVHSHAVKNVGEGLNYFDGTDYQYFHAGARGHHPAWDTKLFDYGKNEVLHFLLSNLKYWM